MKKKLNANAIVLDLRRLTEETLSAIAITMSWSL